MKKTKPITIRVSQELMDVIIKIAKDEDRRPSYVMARFVNQCDEILTEAFKKIQAKKDYTFHKKASL